MNVTLDTHDLLPLRFRVEGQRITKKAYLDTIEVLLKLLYIFSKLNIHYQNGEFYAPEGSSSFWDESTNKLYVIGGKTIAIMSALLLE